MGGHKTITLVVVLVAAVLAMFSVYTISEFERGVLLRLGQIVDDDLKPGLHFKIPGYHTVKKFDARIQTLDAKPESYFTSEEKRVIVDAFVNWRLKVDGGVSQYFKSTKGNAALAQDRIASIINSDMREEFGLRTIQQVISKEREEIMNILIEKANQKVEDYGIEIVDVRIKRIDLPQEVSVAIFERMKTAREKIARDFRFQGREQALKTRADADREVVVLLSNAYKDAEVMRGEADAIAADVYANAYSQDEEFYSFYRRLVAYQNTLNQKSDLLILKPDSEFFKYLNQSGK